MLSFKRLGGPNKKQSLRTSLGPQGSHHEHCVMVAEVVATSLLGRRVFTTVALEAAMGTVAIVC